MVNLKMVIKLQQVIKLFFSPEWLASKVKGGSDPSAQYGALTTKDITYLSDAGENEAVGSGVSFIFQQKEDINVKAASNQYYSCYKHRYYV